MWLKKISGILCTLTPSRILNQFLCYRLWGIPICQLLFLAMLMLLAYGVYASETPTTAVDDAGTTLTLNKTPTRVISLAPHVTEMLFAIGAGDKLVGAVSYSDYPEAAKKIPRIGSYNRFDMERIVALSPDLVVGWKSGNPQGLIERITQQGIPVFLSDPHKLEDVAENMQRLGKLLGQQQQANKVADEFLASLAGFKQKHQAQQIVRVYYEIWDTPLMTLNDQHIISEVIRLCGGKNVFGSESALVPQINMEAVVKENPDVIVVTEITPALNKWRAWTQLTAVKANNLFTIMNPDVLNRHSPRILQGASELCDYLEQARQNLKNTGKTLSN